MSTKEELRQEIEETKVRFHELLDFVPDEAFGLPSDNTAWTVGEVLYHMSIAPKNLGKDVKMILGQSWLYKMFPKVMPKALFNWGNKHLTRYGARHMSREFLAQSYDDAHDLTLKALNTVTEADLRKHLEYPDWDPMLSGDVTLEKLFHYIKAHFDSHEAQIRQIVIDFGMVQK